jgi:hypothetical protein
VSGEKGFETPWYFLRMIGQYGLRLGINKQASVWLSGISLRSKNACIHKSLQFFLAGHVFETIFETFPRSFYIRLGSRNLMSLFAAFHASMLV